MSAAGSPRLAGLATPYFIEQLDQFASGERTSAVMQPIATALSSTERRAVAVYFAHLKASVRVLAAESVSATPDRATDVVLGATLAEQGRWAVGLPPCSSCHAPRGTGVGSRFPPLIGQPAAYIGNQLHAWQAGHRPPGPLGLMRSIASKLSDADIAAVAAYYANLAASEPSSKESSPTQRRALAEEALAGASGHGPSAPAAQGFLPPPRGSEPSGQLGEMIREGERIFLQPDRYAAAYVGNHLRCSSCHLDAGRLARSAPLWAAYVLYPAYRSKNGHVNTFAERLQGCFQFSENGTAPPLGSPVLVALETYSYWLARGAPTGVRLEGQGYPTPPKPRAAPDYTRGAEVYAQHCVLCHGRDGAGQSTAADQVVFPALWGAGSFNWGAGMESIDKAAGFIAANMPLGLGGTLTAQEAWDVALYIDSHERPQDPRFTGSVAETRRRFHDSSFSMYGRLVNGRLLGQGR
ncbi:MAG TPA: c-type cytochrome [Steroidobacteraceae bacterium]|nr:c-type cytochrome [Steroidobacteraceae bacterium]